MASLHSATIQGCFPHGIPVHRLQGTPGIAVQPRLRAGVAQLVGKPIAGKPTHPYATAPLAHQVSAAPRIASPSQALFPVAQPVAQPSTRGNAFQLPSALSDFGRGPGQRLPAAVQQKMEAAFGADFSAVRVHVGPQAAAIGALAFTHGPNIYFGPGQYNPTTPHGQQLLGHELTHVLQQRAGRVRNPFGSGLAVVQDRALEAEADRLGLRAATHQVPVQAKTPSSGPTASPPWPPYSAVQCTTHSARPFQKIASQYVVQRIAFPAGATSSSVIQLAGTKPRTFSTDGRFLVKLTSAREEYVYQNRGAYNLGAMLPGQYDVIRQHQSSGILGFGRAITGVDISYKGRTRTITLKDQLSIPSSSQRILVIDTLGYESGNPKRTSFAMDIKIGTYTKSGEQYRLEGASGPMRLIKYFEHNDKDKTRGSRRAGYDICDGRDDLEQSFQAAKEDPMARQIFLPALTKITSDIDQLVQLNSQLSVTFVGASVFCMFNLTNPQNSVAKLIDPDHPILNLPLNTDVSNIPAPVMTPGRIDTDKWTWDDYWKKWSDSFEIGLKAVFRMFNNMREELQYLQDQEDNRRSLDSFDFSPNPYLFRPNEGRQPPRLNLPENLPGLTGVATDIRFNG